MTDASLIGTTLAHYQILELIGQGGMATVYLAEDQKHRRQVALKVMKPERAKAIGHDRFLREIETVARLNHPHILALHDSGAQDNQLYYVMPYVIGGTLRDRLNKEEQLSIEEALRITKEIASGLAHAHSQGLVHRDIKPENILLVDDIALVADFGIARAAAETAASEAAGGTSADEDAATMDETKAGVILGTPRYMSPEQASGQEVDARADLYSLACILYEMLAGQRPFNAPTPDALMRMHVTVAPQPITELRPSVPQGIANAIARALAKLPAERFDSAALFAEALATGAISGATPTPSPGGTEQAVPNNLPRQRTHFIGRKKELAECASILGETRLLTLTGVGGSGKTRLALKLAESMLTTIQDGVWFVDLGPLDAEALVPQVVARSLGAEEFQGKQPTELIIELLRNRRALLIIDNCEHLLSACAVLCDQLLAELPDLKLLITSREGLGMQGERLFPVLSLAMPAEGETDIEVIGSAEAVRLFEMRAREANSEFKLNEQNAPMVSEICRRLDGIPLAIELAAARIRALSVEQIRTLLDDRFRLLTGGSRSALERHRTLRATVQWSYDHLEDEEKRLFVDFAVFSGGWSLPAAAAIHGQDTFEVLDLTTRLIDKSLVIPEGQSREEVRYRMLETLRQYGEELLFESGRANELRSEHLLYFLKRATHLTAQLNPDEGNPIIGRFIPDLENYRAAFEWGLVNDPVAAARLMVVLWPLWVSGGYIREGTSLGTRVLEIEDQLDPELKAELRYRMGHIAFKRGDYKEACDLYLEVLPKWWELKNRLRIAMTLRRLGGAETYLEDHESALQHLDEALTLFTELDEPIEVAKVHNDMGLSDYLNGNYDSARARFEFCEAANQAPEELGNLQVILGNLAMLDVAQELPAEARAHLRKSFEINNKIENSYGMAHDLPTLAAIFRLEEDPQTAARVLGANDALLEKIGAGLEAVEKGLYETTELALRSELGDHDFETARETGRAMTWAEYADLV